MLEEGKMKQRERWRQSEPRCVGKDEAERGGDGTSPDVWAYYILQAAPEGLEKARQMTWSRRRIKCQTLN